MAKPARSLMDLPELVGWLTFGEAAREMNISVERVRQLASEPHPKLTTARRIGRRPLGIVREAEVREWIARKEASRREVEAGRTYSEEPPPATPLDTGLSDLLDT
jgi:hypothetical protein